MFRGPRIAAVIVLVVTALAVGCQGSGASPGSTTPQKESGSSPTKRLTLVVPNEPPILYYPLAPSATRGSAGLIYDLVGPGLALGDNDGVLHPLTAQNVPSIENGLWTVSSDGRMQTTWTIRKGAL